jgi:Tol biopolymer transport system component
MRIRISAAATAVVALTLAAGAQSRPAQTPLEAARNMEVVDGNPSGAVTLGQSETTTFAQVGSTRGPVSGTVSPDGRYLSLTDWDTGNLALRDLATGMDRLLTDDAKLGEQIAGSSAISRDGRLVAYAWLNETTRSSELRVVPVQGVRGKPRQLYVAPNGSSMTPYDWSPDGRWIAVALYARRPAPSQFGVVSTETGSLRILGDANTSTLKFSPDGQLLAFEGQHISAVTIDGSRVTDLVTDDGNNWLMGWSPDGRWLLFTSDRMGSGSDDLWAVEVTKGLPQGQPRLLKAGVGGSSLGMTASGSLLLFVRTNTSDVRVVSVDLASGRVIGTPVQPIPTFVGTNVDPSWTSDGKLVYTSRGYRPGGPILAVRDLATSQVQEVVFALGHFLRPRLSPDGKSFIGEGIDPTTGRRGIYRVDAATGAATPVEFLDKPGYANPVWSPNGQAIYYIRTVDGQPGEERTRALVARDLASGAIQELFRYTGNGGAVAVSSDGRTIALARQQDILAIPTAGGPPRTLATVAPAYVGGLGLTWTSDGRHLVLAVRDTPNGNGRRVAIVPVDGSPIRTLDVGVRITAGYVQLSPDDRRLAFVGGGRVTWEFWKLEHFLPPAGSAR